ncbi:hypothetical protein KSP40_PGU001523 [Platanthera guangdongensis]|uniref:Uncharacterized protein n=1 Tax=Platanthera guangdongensis TaxID=2320717 RepID=A0ABR2M6V1_9ASPA
MDERARVFWRRGRGATTVLRGCQGSKTRSPMLLTGGDAKPCAGEDKPRAVGEEEHTAGEEQPLPEKTSPSQKRPVRPPVVSFLASRILLPSIMHYGLA